MTFGSVGNMRIPDGVGRTQQKCFILTGEMGTHPEVVAWLWNANTVIGKPKTALIKEPSFAHGKNRFFTSCRRVTPFSKSIIRLNFGFQVRQNFVKLRKIETR